jgi:hypothetical protein
VGLSGPRPQWTAALETACALPVHARAGPGRQLSGTRGSGYVARSANRSVSFAGLLEPTPGLEPGALHYERTTSEGRASTRGHGRARSRRNLTGFAPLSVDAHARACPSSRTRFVPATPLESRRQILTRPRPGSAPRSTCPQRSPPIWLKAGRPADALNRIEGGRTAAI